MIRTTTFAILFAITFAPAAQSQGLLKIEKEFVESTAYEKYAKKVTKVTKKEGRFEIETPCLDMALIEIFKIRIEHGNTEVLVKILPLKKRPLFGSDYRLGSTKTVLEGYNIALYNIKKAIKEEDSNLYKKFKEAEFSGVQTLELMEELMGLDAIRGKAGVWERSRRVAWLFWVTEISRTRNVKLQFLE